MDVQSIMKGSLQRSASRRQNIHSIPKLFQAKPQRLQRMSKLMSILRFWLLVYHIFVIFFRVCFQCYPMDTRSWPILLIDYCVDAFYFIDYFLPLYLARTARGGVSWRHDLPTGIATILFELVVAVPLELILYYNGYAHYGEFRMMKLLRLWYFRRYWEGFVSSLEGVLTSIASQRVVFFLLMHALISHMGACISYGIALSGSMQDDPVKNNMIVQSKLGYFEGNTLHENHTCTYRYLRFMYWAVNVVETVGFGDIVPKSWAELGFNIVLFYAGFLVIAFTVSNFIVLMNGLDAAKTNYLDRVDKLMKFFRIKNLPTSLRNKISAYYEHQLLSLNGVDEAQLLAELPSHIQAQILEETVVVHLRSVKLLQNLPSMVISRLSDQVKVFNYSQDDVVVAAGSITKGMYIVSRGKLHMNTSTNKTAKIKSPVGSRRRLSLTSKDGYVLAMTLNVGESFGEKALVEPYVFTYTVMAGTGLNEVLYLSRNKFRHVCRTYMSDEKCKEMADAILGLETRTNAHISQDPKKIRKNGTVSGSLRNVAVVELPSLSGGLMFSPQSSFRTAWNILIFAGIVFYLVEVPMMLAFMLNDNWFPSFFRELIASYVFDIIFAIDLLLRMRYFYFKSNGILIVRPREILAHYMRRSFVYLISDVLSLLPLDLIALSAGLMYLPTLRIGKIFRAIYLFECGEAIENDINRLTGVYLSFTARRMVIMLAIQALLCHWVACVYSLIGDLSRVVYNADHNWKQQDRDAEFFSLRYSDNDFHAVYRRALYWSLNVMTSNGSGDMPASNIIETIYCTIVMLFGCPFIATVLGNIASLMSNLDTTRTDFENKVSRMGELLTSKSIDDESQQKFFFFYDYKWERTGGVDEAELLSSLPRSLRENVTKSMIGGVLVNIPFFDKCSDHFLDKILEMLQPRAFLDGDAIAQEGEFGKDLFIVDNGLVEITNSSRDVTYTTLGPGSYFGESSLLKVSKRTASAYAKGYCDIYALSKDSFLEITEMYPKESEMVLEMIQHILDKKKETNTAIRAEIQTEKEEAADTVSSIKHPELMRGTSSFFFGKLSRESSNQSMTQSSVNENDSNLSMKTDTHDPPVSSLRTKKILRNDTNLEMTSIGRKVAVTAESDLHARSSSLDKFILPGMEPRLKPKREMSRMMSVYGLTTANYTAMSQEEFQKGGNMKLKSRLLIVVFAALLYNLFMVPLRISLNEVVNPSIYCVDYLLDLVLWIDSFFNWTIFPTVHAGRVVNDTVGIREMYMKKYFRLDLIARFPYELLLLFFTNYSTDENLFILSFLRIPRLILIVRSRAMLAEFERFMSDYHFSFLHIRLVEIFVALCTVGHWLGCFWLLLIAFKDNAECDETLNYMFGSRCDLRSTWVQFLIYFRKAPHSGGSALTRYIMALNWSVPTMTLFVIGDTWPVNIRETTFVFAVLFFAVALQGFVVGNVMSVTSADPDTIILSDQADSIESYLIERKVSPALIQRMNDYFNKVLDAQNRYMLEEDKSVGEMPFTLQTSYAMSTRLHLLDRCTFFNFCSSEALQSLCMAMKLHSFGAGDIIVACGEIGSEMYFIDEGSVEVRSGDGKLIYATLQKGQFFGETGMVFCSERSATIAATSFCLIYVLTKVDLDAVLRNCDFEADQAVSSLERLQETNQFINNALKVNLQKVSDKSHKLSRMIPTVDHNLARIRIIFAHFDEKSMLRLLLDIMGLSITMYYMLMIPYNIAFYDDKMAQHITAESIIQYIMDAFCFLEFITKLCFLRASSKVRHPSPFLDSRRSLSVAFVSLLPLELLVLLPAVPFHDLYALRLVRLCRVFNISQQFALVVKHSLRFNIRVPRQQAVVLKICLAYVYLNHWISCMYFALHRFVLSRSRTTYMVGYGLAEYNEATERHNVCSVAMSKCYFATYYFIATVLTSVGFGDLGPYQDVEMLFQVIIAIISAFMGAFLVGQIGNMQTARDNSNRGAFADKIRRVSQFSEFKGFSPAVKNSIRKYYEHTWASERSLGNRQSSYLGLLSKPLAAEIALELNDKIINCVPTLRNTALYVRKLFAFSLQPQAIVLGAMIYDENEAGQYLYFISSGRVGVFAPKPIAVTESNFPNSKDNASKLNMNAMAADCVINEQSKLLMRRKVAVLSGGHIAGDHFGEYCLVSRQGIRVSKAVAMDHSEVYAISKSNLLEIFRVLTHQARCDLLLSLFCTVGCRQHTPNPEVPSGLEDLPLQTFSATSLCHLSASLLESIVNQFADTGDTLEIQTLQRLKGSRRRSGSIDSEGSDSAPVETNQTSCLWSAALASYHTKARSNKSANDAAIKGSFKRSDSLNDLRTLVEDRVSTRVPGVGALQKPEDDIGEGLRSLVREMFTNFDTDQSGFIDRDELKAALSALGVDMGWKEIDHMISQADFDGNQQVDIQEATQAVIKEILSSRQAVEIGGAVQSMNDLEYVRMSLRSWKEDSPQRIDEDKTSVRPFLHSWSELMHLSSSNLGSIKLAPLNDLQQQP